MEQRGKSWAGCHTATVPHSHSHHVKLAIMKIQNENILKSVCIKYTTYHSLLIARKQPTTHSEDSSSNFNQVLLFNLSLICCCYISLVALVAQPSKSKSSW